jgi:hypothetical protein
MSDANPQAADPPAYIPQPAGQVPAAPAQAGSAPAGGPVQVLRSRVIAIDAHRYRVKVRPSGGGDRWDAAYNPLAYIPKQDEEVWVAVFAGAEPGALFSWVLGVGSWDMFQSATYGRPPTAALWSATSQTVTSGAGNLLVVEMDHKAWDTDNMLVELGDDQKTTKITPQRAGVYTIKAGGRWEKDPRSRGRRGMDLRWDTGLPWDDTVTIARDEKAPNSEGLCSHSVSADIRITTSIDPAHASPWVRYLGAAVQLVVYQTSGHDLRLLSDQTSRPFLQMTYQGPMP